MSKEIFQTIGRKWLFGFLILLFAAFLAVAFVQESVSALSIYPGSAAVHSTSPPAPTGLSGVLPAVSAEGSSVVTTFNLLADAKSMGSLSITEAANARYAQVVIPTIDGLFTAQSTYLAPVRDTGVVAITTLPFLGVVVSLSFIFTVLVIVLGGSITLFIEQPDFPMSTKKRRISKRFGAPILSAIAV